MEHSNSERYTYLEVVLPITKFFSLRKFRGHMVGLVQNLSFLLIPNSLVTPLRSIELSWLLLDDYGIRRILKCCPKLEAFSLEWGDGKIEGYGIYYSRIGDVIRNFGQNLRDIAFNNRESFFFEANLQYSHHPLSDLTSLKLLRQRSLSRTALLGPNISTPGHRYPQLIDILPRSI